MVRRTRVTGSVPGPEVEARGTGDALLGLCRRWRTTFEKKLRVKFDDFGEYGLHIIVNFLLDVPDVEVEKAERQRIFLEILKLADTMDIQFAIPPRVPQDENLPG